MRAHALADHGDRPLRPRVHVHEGPPLRLRPPDGLDPDAQLLELAGGAVTELVVAERGKKQAVPGEAPQLDRCDGTSAAGLLPRLERVHDLARGRDMPDDRDAHQAYARARSAAALIPSPKVGKT